jgi:hypothetical protein
MAKRFIDTGLFDDEWFIDLSKEQKIIWVYCITKCDHAGLLHLNLKLAPVQTGIKDILTVIKELGNRIVTVREQLFFIPKFIEFQYPGFPKSKVKQQASAIDLLIKYNLFDEENYTLRKQLANCYVNDNVNVNDNDKGGVGEKLNPNEKPKEKTWRNDFETYKHECLTAYQSILIDTKFISEQERYNPGVDIALTLEKAVMTFWSLEAGWKNKKSSRSMNIDWVATFRNAISLNKVYKQKQFTPPPSEREPRSTRPEYKLLDENAR